MEFRQFETISTKDIGKTLDLRGKVETIKQTAGPTLMILNDGTGNFTFKAFIKPGVRAFPEIEAGDLVYVSAVINERKDTIEGEVKSMKKLALEDIEDFQNHIHEKNAAKVEAGFKRNLREAGIKGVVNRVGSMMTLFFNDKEKLESFDEVMTSDRERYAEFFKF